MTEETEQVEAAWKAMKRQLNALCEAIAGDPETQYHLPREQWLPTAALPLLPTDTPQMNLLGDLTGFAEVRFVYTRLTYLDGQDPRTTLLYPAALGVSRPVLALAREANEAKLAFKAAVDQLRKALSASNAGRFPALDAILRHLGASRVSLKQCYRTLPLIEKSPARIAWSWSRTRAIKQLTAAEVRRKLQGLRNPAEADRYLAALAHQSDEELFAQVQELAPHLRANVTFADGSKPRMIKAPIPVLYWRDPVGKPPEVELPPRKPGEPTRQTRSDQRIDPQPLIPPLRIHRYQRPPKCS